MSGIVEDNIKDIRSLNFWRALSAELMGTMFLVLMSCGSATNWPGNIEDHIMPSIVQISLTFAFSVATMVWAIAHVSGGHINPAVTVGMAVTRKITLVRALLYIIAQCIGGIIGAAILYSVTPESIRSQPNSLGATSVNPDITAGQAFGVELLITFVLVFTVFATCDGNRKDLSGSGPLAIGLSIGMCHLFAIKFTGAGMNCARSFGPAVVSGQWDDHWVYWAGPLLGGIAAGLLYEFIFSAESIAKFDKRGTVGDVEESSELKTSARPATYQSRDAN